MNKPDVRVHVLPDASAAASHAAEHIAGSARAAVEDHATFTLAVSGGRTPWLMLADLARLDLPWDRITLLQVDERIGPADDPQRNLIGLREALPPDCPARVLPMPVEAADLTRASLDYARALPPSIDLVQLGLGADGHTASLIPGDPVLGVDDRDVALTGTYQDRRRMTLTYRPLGRAREVLWLVTGAEKRVALTQLLARDPTIPASRVTTPAQVLFCDAAAAGQDAGPAGR